MALGRDRWVEVTPSRFPHERNGLEYVRAALPDQDPYRAWTGVEIITDRGRSLDVDLLVIGPAGIYVVELNVVDPLQRVDNFSLRLRRALTLPALRTAVTAAQDRPLAVPAINDEALPGLKFSTALPRSLAVEALGARLADPHGAVTVLREPSRSRQTA